MATFNYNFKIMVDWYDENLDNTHIFEDDQNVICFLIVNGTKYEKISDKQKRCKVCINQDNKPKIVDILKSATFPINRMKRL